MNDVRFLFSACAVSAAKRLATHSEDLPATLTSF